MAEVVILGAGYAGLMALKVLQQHEHRNLHITLVDQNDYHYEATDLHEVAAGALTAERITYPIMDVVDTQQTTFIKARVKRIARDTHEVILDGNRSISYDYLIVGLGFQAETFNIPGAKEHALQMTTVREAEKIADHINDQMLAFADDQDERHLTIAIAGAGFTGVELLGALAEQRDRLAELAGVSAENIKLVAVDGAPRPLGMFSEKLVQHGLDALRKSGATILSGQGIDAVSDGVVHYHDRATDETGQLNAGTIIWTTGVSGSDVMTVSGYVGKRNRVPVNEYLQDANDARIYIVGDVAAAENPDGGLYPTTAQLALVMGRLAAENILREIEERPLETFSYHSLGTVCSIGNTYAIGEVGAKAEVHGYPASMLKKVILNKSLLETGGVKEMLAKGRFDLYH